MLVNSLMKSAQIRVGLGLIHESKRRIQITVIGIGVSVAARI